MDIKVLEMVLATTSTGKPYKKLKVECEGEVRELSYWNNYPDYANIATGLVFKAKMIREGKYWKLEFENAKPRGNSNFKTEQMEKVMDKKAGQIEEFQDKKNDHIILSATFRDATLLTVAQVNQQEVKSEKEIEEIWLRWRTWLANQFGDKLSDIQKPF